MATIRRTITIFISHPGDVTEEVEAIKKLCANFDTAYRNNGFNIDARDYRDLPSGAGNPQVIINDALTNKCDIFVGVLKESIGQDGFREEVAIGLKRHEEEQIPFNFFVRKTDSEESEEGKKRTAFLEPIRQKMLYSGYNNLDDFKDVAGRDILDSIVKAVKKFELIKLPPGGETNSKVNKKIKKAEEKKTKNVDIKVIAEKIVNTIDVKLELDEYEKVRIFLFSASQLYDDKVSSEILGNHEDQLLYKFKEKVHPAFTENKLILRTILSDVYGRKAGWFWLQFKNGFRTIFYLANYLLQKDSSDDVREGALNLIGRIISTKDIRILKGYQNDGSENIKLKVLEILEDHPSKNSLKIVEDYLGNAEEKISKKAKSTKIKILSLTNLRTAISELLKSDDIESFRIPRSIYLRAYEGELRQLSQHKDEWIKIDALRELIGRRKLSEDELNKLLLEKNWNCRYLALEGLLGLGKKLTPDYVREALREDGDPFKLMLSRAHNFSTEDLIKKACKNLTLQELVETMEWGYDGSIIYEFIATNKYDKFADELKRDLADDFKKRQDELIQKGASKTGLAPGVLKDILDKYQDFIKKSFYKAAFKALVLYGDKSFLKYAYPLIDDDDHDLRKTIIKFIEKFGNQKDALLIAESALRKNSYYDDETLISAFKLDKTGKLLKENIEGEHEKFTPIALAYCFANKIKPDEKRVFDLLYSKIDKIRDVAIQYIVLIFDRKECEKTLRDYISKEVYYYSVVSILDRVLYSPKELSDIYMQEIKDKLLSKLR